MNKDILLNKILSDVEYKHNKALKDVDLKKEHLLNTYPELEEIENNLNKLYIKKSQSLLLNISTDDINLIEKKIEYYNNLKNNLLQKLKISGDYLKPIFECTICNDTGFFENSNGNRQLCKCVKQALINERYNKSNIGNLEKDNFNNFSYNMYSDEINKEKYNSNISPRENIKHIRKIAENFINNFNDINEKNLLFTGNTGLRENISFKLYSKRIIR